MVPLFPKLFRLFCAVIGAGTQLLVLVLFIFALALIGVFYPYNRGAPYTACIVLYALTAGIAGYVSASLYRQMEGDNWVSLFPWGINFSRVIFSLKILK